jgi:AcrR family transcriptional regulator
LPVQARSKQRVQSILDVAEHRLIELGYDELKMSDIAKLAGVPIGSVYQYFPNKTAIISSLLQVKMQETQAEIKEELSRMSNGEDLLQYLSNTVSRLVDTLYKRYRYDDSVRALWNAARSDHRLQDLVIEDNLANGGIIYHSLHMVVPHIHADRIKAVANMVCDIIGSALRMAASVDKPQGDIMAEELKVMINSYCMNLLER